MRENDDDFLAGQVLTYIAAGGLALGVGIGCIAISTYARGDEWCGKVRPECAHMLGATPGHPVYQPAGRSLGGVVAPLASKVHEITAACGSRVLSGMRHTRVAGTRRMSLHSYGEAVDVSGNPSCIYAHLSGWPGGYSVDYGRVRHVHISYEPNGREWGARFAHGGGHHHKHRRYARAI